MDATMDDGNGSPINGSLASQMPLPNPPGPDSAHSAHMNNSGDSASDHSSSQLQRNHSQRSKSNADTAISDEAADAAGMSDAESNADEGSGKSGRKKKSQRFYCTEYPPCNLSFTRSEHLARHIRKHTGERPFECHCLRRFSRLDNLRQHAQTVHMHEDIPLGSLAATGTRFQRQIRPERVRVAPGGRARAGSIGGPARGHSKSFSTSNIALGPGPFVAREDMRDNRDMRDVRDPRDVRPRPPPLATLDARARQHMESSVYHATTEGYQPMTPPELTTPTSSTFSNGPASPHWGSNRVVSPSPFNSRPHSMYATTETPSRRLSVPSAESMHFQSPPGPHQTNRHMYSVSASNNSGLFSSPDRANNAAGRPVSPDNSSISASWSRRESFSSTIDERRRTWHPSSRDFGGPAGARNGVPGAAGPITSVSAGNVMNGPPGGAPYQQAGPDPQLPMANASGQQSSGLRLPGIDSFLNMPSHRPVSPPRRGPSPMAIDSERYPPAASGPPTSILRSPIEQQQLHHAVLDNRRPSSGHWESGLQHGLNRLDIASRTPPQDTARDWANNQPAHQTEEKARRNQQHQPSVRFESDVVREDPFSVGGRGGGSEDSYTRGHQHTMSAPAFNAATSRQLKRQAWYNGPSGAAVSNNAGRVERMVHPNLANGFAGFPARGVPQTVHEHQPHPQDQDSAAAYHHEQQQQQQQKAAQDRAYDRYRAGPSPREQRDERQLPPSQQSQQQLPPLQQQMSQNDSDSYRRLDALVAVATSEVKASTQAF